MKQPRKYSKNFAIALIGLLFIGTGLVLAAISNPARFSLDVQNDNTIDLYAVSGLLCTVVGVGLFVTAARQTTQSMPAVHRTKANLGVGFGLVLQLAGLFLPFSLEIPGLAGPVLVVASLPPFVWGTMSFAEGKGYPRQFGLAGILGLVGLVCLMLLPDQNEETNSAG
jgi:hypothetical protein